jgi:hypothetical protein
MKKGIGFNGIETISFGPENKLRVFPPNSYKFKPKDHIILDETQECILDNFWYMYNNKREEKGYMLSILNSLAEYFNMMNGMIPSSENVEAPELKPLYILYDGKAPGIYISFEKILAEKVEAKYTGGVSWKKYMNIDEALTYARKVLGVNYYIEPIAKEYIQKYKKAHNKKVPIEMPTKRINEEGTSSKKLTYKQCLVGEVDPLDGEYIDQKIEEKFEQIYPEWKKNIKEEVLKEVQKEISEKFEKLKKEFDTSFDFSQFMNEEIENKTDVRMEDSQIPE